MNKINVTAFVGFVFAVMAFLKIGLPDTVTQAGVVEAIMAITASAIIIMRFRHGDEYAKGVKEWYQSKIVWTQIGTALFAVLALFGVRVGISLEQFASFAMVASTGLTMILGTGGNARIGRT